jgi:carbamoyl-phosphate synthase large subunit
LERKIEASPWPLDKEFLLELKKTGFSDAQIAGIAGKTADEVRGLRREFGVRPIRRQIDTLAAEYAAQTNYLYLSYDGTIDEAIDGKDKKVLILGSGVYRIGSP